MDLTDKKPEIPQAFMDRVKEVLKAHRNLVNKFYPESVKGILPCSIFAQPADVIQAAVPVMMHYRAKDFDRLINLYNAGTFDPEKPAFCQLWGMAKHHAEVLAYYGSSTVGYPLLIPVGRWQSEYELD